MHQELLSEDHVFWTTFGINIRVLMLQRKETSVMLNYVNTVSDMKLSISCETNILISRDTILGQTGPGGENDIIFTRSSGDYEFVSEHVQTMVWFDGERNY